MYCLQLINSCYFDVTNVALLPYFTEYESICNQEWIVFQKRLHLLDEFVCRWLSRLEPYTAVTLYMQQELDKYTVSVLT